MQIKNVVIVGLGMIGGSIAAALKKYYPELHIVGADVDSRSCEVALGRAWIDEACMLSPTEMPDGNASANPPERDDEASRLKNRISSADLMFLAVPLTQVDGYLRLVKDTGFSGILTDTTSAKAHLLETAAAMLLHPENFIPGHPMTGSEVSGIDGARPDLFEGTNWILCPDDVTNPDAFTTLHELISGMNVRVIFMKREQHDAAMAIVSHVPHMVASALVQLAAHHADDSGAIMRLAAGGFKDTTRIAAGSPKLWSGIALDNSLEIQSGINEICEILIEISREISNNDQAGLMRLLQESANVRRNLPGKWIPSSEKLIEVRVPMVNKPGVVAEVTTIASSAACNIQSIEIDHISEGNAVLSLVLTDEGDIGKLSSELIKAGYSVTFNPLA